VIEGVEVRWPYGHVDRFQEMLVDTAYVLKEGQARALNHCAVGGTTKGKTRAQPVGPGDNQGAKRTSSHPSSYNCQSSPQIK
jgi:hypothetical protein